jgi:PAS domain S-box-containing protein
MSEHSKRGEFPTRDDVDSILHYFESMDLINSAIQGTSDLDQMLGSVLDTVLSIFDCDRTFLQYPCDPQAAVWRVPVERSRAEFPGISNPDQLLPKDKAVAESQRKLLQSKQPLTFGIGNRYRFEGELPGKYAIRSLMMMAIFPKTGKPWQFGIQQCSRERVWTQAESVLFKEIGRRLADGLSLLLAFQELKAEETSYSRIVNLANEGIWRLDAEGRTSYVNTRMAEILGYRPDELLGRPVTDFMFEEDLPEYLNKMAAGFHSVSPVYERRYRRKQGEAVWVSISATGITDKEGKFAGGFGMVTDITEKRQAEEDLRRLNEELEARVKARTRELQSSHADLEVAYRELKLAHASMLQQEKMASISQLAAGIAHEINTPNQYVSNNVCFLRDSLGDLLAGVRACRDAFSAMNDGVVTDGVRRELESQLEAVDFDYLNEEIPRALQESTEGLSQIADIVVAMKEFSHPSGTRLEPVDLEKLIQTTVEISRNAWKMVAELNLEPASSPMIVNGLRDELGQVVLNLIMNAVDAIIDAPPLGGGLGRIRILTRAAGDWAEIVVEDSGCGIEPSLKRKVFEPFFTTKQVGRGSGQGLAIAYHIVTDKHGGELLVDSAPGEGSTFTVRLPL